MIDDTGNLSIDFLAGFTIFMIAFIYVATMIPGLFIGLQSKTIDYDAVAYRTGVILAEDPGMPYNPSWATLTDYNKDNVLRFGLALSRDTPNILSQAKVDRFFCSTWTSEDYRSRAVFGDYPYKFNVSLQIAGDDTTQSIGDPLPDGGYGYSRRIVKIKDTSNTTIAPNEGAWHQDYQTKENVSEHLFSVYLNYTKLVDDGPNMNLPAYQINPILPLGEGITINLTELEKTTNPNDYLIYPNPTNISLSQISVYRSRSLPSQPTQHSSFSEVGTDSSQYKLFIDGNTTPVNLTGIPERVKSNVSLVILPGILNNWGGGRSDVPGDSSTWLNITMQFNLTDGQNPPNPQPDWFLNSTKSLPYGAFEYNYIPANVTQPRLRDAVMEVAVW